MNGSEVLRADSKKRLAQQVAKEVKTIPSKSEPRYFALAGRALALRLSALIAELPPLAPSRSRDSSFVRTLSAINAAKLTAARSGSRGSSYNQFRVTSRGTYTWACGRCTRNPLLFQHYQSFRVLLINLFMNCSPTPLTPCHFGGSGILSFLDRDIHLLQPARTLSFGSTQETMEHQRTTLITFFALLSLVIAARSRWKETFSRLHSEG